MSWKSVSSWVTQQIECLSGSGVKLFFFYLLIALAQRGFAFGFSVIDWDETNYILMAQALKQGYTLYIDTWDFKPPGIFWIFSGILSLPGPPILLIRIFGTFSVAGTAWMLHRLVLRLLPGERKAAFFAGWFFLVGISFQSISFALSRGLGLEVNTEHFFLFFTIWAFAVFAKEPGNLTRVFIAGLIIGFSFMIKYYVLFDMLALIGFSFWWHRNNWQKGFQSAFVCGLGMLVPFLSVLGYYYFFTPNWDAYYEVTFEIGSRYSSEFFLSKAAKLLGDFFYVGWPMALCMLLGIISLIRNKQKSPLVILLVWMLLIAIGVMLPGKFYFHYLYQLFPPFAVLAALWLTSKAQPQNLARTNWATGIAIFLVVTLPLVSAIRWNNLQQKGDTPREIAEYLKPKMLPEDEMYVFNYKHVIYVLNDRLPPTKYFFPSLLYNPEHAEAIGIDMQVEQQKIMNTKPKYVVYNEKAEVQEFLTLIENDYSIEKIFEEPGKTKIRLYVRNPQN